MIVFNRKHGEAFQIHTPAGDVISIAVDKSRQNQVRVIVDAPEGYTVLRSELRDRILSQKKVAVEEGA